MDLVSITHLMALTAGVINILGFWRYNKATFFGSAHPNAATSFLWALVTTINLTSYYNMEVERATLVVMSSDTILCVFTFFFLLFKGKFGKLKTKEWVAIGFSVGAIVLWKLTSAAQGNFLTQIPMVISFLPILDDTRTGRTIEDVGAWALWVISFVLNFAIVCLTWKHGMDFVYPIVAIIMHVTILCYAIRGRRLYA